jgi:hypothetical protein
VLLQARIDKVRQEVKADSTLVQSSGDFKKALNRLALSAVTKRDLERLQRDSTSPAKTDSILRKYYPDVEGDSLGSGLLHSLASTRLGSNTSEPDEVHEYETGELIRRVKLSNKDDYHFRADLDTLSMLARAVVIERKLRMRHFFPVRGHSQAEMFWGQSGMSALNIGFIAGTGSQGVAYTELASPLLHFVRISVNGVLAAAKEHGSDSAAETAESGSDEATVMRFINGGGVMNIAAAAPVLYLSAWHGKSALMLLAHPRIGGTIPALGASERDSTLIYDAGMEMHALTVDPESKTGLFLQVRSAFAGGTGQFAELLGTDRSHFVYTTLTAGLSLGDRYVINAARVMVGPRSLRTRGWQLGITALRGAEPATGH